MAKLSNLLVMIELLKNGRKYSVKELANYLEVSERVVREYKVFLEEAGIYVDSIKGPYGGYVLRQDINLPSPIFNESDIELIKKCFNKLNDFKVKEELKNLENKITSNIIINEKRPLINDEEHQVYNNLSYAIKNHFKVKIEYHNLKHGVSIRTIYPLSLYVFQNEWWCSSYWEEQDDMRQFHIKRITKCDISNSKFNPDIINVKF